MLDRRDIQTVMYCTRLTEASAHWREASSKRSPHDLELEIAELLRAIAERRITPAA
jgi:hypothetical protein